MAILEDISMLKPECLEIWLSFWLVMFKAVEVLEISIKRLHWEKKKKRYEEYTRT